MVLFYNILNIRKYDKRERIFKETLRSQNEPKKNKKKYGIKRKKKKIKNKRKKQA